MIPGMFKEVYQKIEVRPPPQGHGEATPLPEGPRHLHRIPRLSEATRDSCLENPHGQRSLVGYSPWDHVELDMTSQQNPPSLGFSRQEHWSGLPFPSPMHESEK